MRIEFSAPPQVRDTIAALGRTEDIKFSPSNRRLAVAGYAKSRIFVFDVSIGASAAGTQISLTDVAEYFSPLLNFPHGLDFVDEETLIVANREGDVPIFKLPPGKINHELELLEVLRADGVLYSPGSVCVMKNGDSFCEALICNNYRHYVTRHRLECNSGISASRRDILIRKWIEEPDGVAASADGQWIAVSNHSLHSVFLYENTASLNDGSDPDGILRCVHYPHGLRFTGDGRHILVADAGGPFVHVYAKGNSSWRGVRNPLVSIRAMSERTFMAGRTRPEEGGPKGIDVDKNATVLVMTSEFQPIAFIDLAAVLDRNGAKEAGSEPDEAPGLDRQSLEIAYELGLMARRNRDKAIEARLVSMVRSRSWRMIAPLRRAYARLRRLAGLRQ